MKMRQNYSCRSMFRCTVLVICLTCWGCNNARYSLSYNQRVDTIETVAVLPLGILAQSLHAGGALEPMPDLTKDISERVLEEIRSIVSEQGRKPTAPQLPTSRQVGGSPHQALPLATAVKNAIFLHHYEYGKGRTLDYTLGDTVRSLCGPNDDTVLFVSLSATVPTEGRKALAVTAIIVSALSGVSIAVPTRGIDVILMLVDTSSGEVLWYNRKLKAADARKDKSLRKFLRQASKYLFVPIKE